MIKTMNEYTMQHLKVHEQTFSDISNIVALHFNESIDKMKGAKRYGNIIMTRNIAIHFMFKHIDTKIYSESSKHRIIGHYLKRNRLTIRHHQINTQFLILNDNEYKQHYMLLKLKLKTNDII